MIDFVYTKTNKKIFKKTSSIETKQKKAKRRQRDG